MNLLLSFFKKNRLKIAFLLGGIVILFVAFHFYSHRGTSRRVFMYPVAGSPRTQREIRYLDSNPVQGKIAYYVDELILGPSFYRGRSLFSRGTKVDYCFLRGKSLYVGLSGEAILQDGGAVEMSRSVPLFKKNIKKNFSGIKNIELFIDGNFISD